MSDDEHSYAYAAREKEKIKLHIRLSKLTDYRWWVARSRELRQPGRGHGQHA